MQIIYGSFRRTVGNDCFGEPAFDRVIRFLKRAPYCCRRGITLGANNDLVLLVASSLSKLCARRYLAQPMLRGTRRSTRSALPYSAWTKQCLECLKRA